jgi:hypothetical protein
VIVRIETDARHTMIFMATPQVFPPVRKLGIDTAEGNQKVLSVLTAGGSEPRIHTSHVPAQQGLETTCPGLCHALPAKAHNELCRIIAHNAPERPTIQVHVRINHGSAAWV